VGGSSSRLGQDKGLQFLAGKPLAKYVLDAMNNIVGEKILVASSREQAGNYWKIFGSDVTVLIDRSNVEEAQSPLVGASAGLKEAHGRYVALLPCDTPFISRNVISLLFELCIDRNAVIPRWPNGCIEPLQAVYCTKPAYEAAKSARNQGKLNMQSMIDNLSGVRYISTLVLEQIDWELKTFFNINNSFDLKKAEKMLRQ
jgi:molybdopterin-guanine dinucleotide biosynthesis protein A